MDTRFVLPVSAATALHALIFWGFNPGHSPTTSPVPTHDSVDDRTPIEVVVDPVVSPDDPPPDVNSTPKGSPDALRPTLDEPAAAHGDFEMPRPAEYPKPTTVVATIVPGPPGDPLGTDGNWSGTSVVNFDKLDNPPRTRSQTPPAYPHAARAAGLTGEVLVEFLVDETGHVQNPRIVRSTDNCFESPTLRAVQLWRFEPGKKSGRPVRFRMVAPVTFSLEN